MKPNRHSTINFTIDRGNLQKLAFPKACFRCGNAEELASLKLSETTLSVRALSKPANIFSVLLFIIVAGSFAGFSEVTGIHVVWLFVLAYALLYSILRSILLQSCRSIDVPYCRHCISGMKARRTIAAVLGWGFVASITAIMFLQTRTGDREGFPSWLAVTCTLCFIFGVFGRFDAYDPEIHMQKKAATTSIDISGSDNGRQTLDLNKEIILRVSEE